MSRPAKVKYECDVCGGDVIDVIEYSTSTESYWYCKKCDKNFYDRGNIPCATVHVDLKRKGV